MRFLSLPLFSAVLLALSGCQPPPPPVPGALANPGTTVLATVNGSNITQEMVDAQLKQLPDSVRSQLEKSGGVSRIKDNLVAQELLYQEAVKAKSYDTPDMAIPLALSQRQVLAQAILHSEVDKRLTDARLQQWYQDHLVQFAKPQVSADHIIVTDEKQAKDIVAKAKAGTDFADLAKQFSQDKATANDGGKLGWLSQRDVRDPDLAKAMFAANKGDVLDPIKGTGGFQIVKIEDKRDQVPFEEVKDAVKSQAERDVQQEYLDELKKAAKIEDKGGDAAPAGGAPGSSVPGMPSGHPPMSSGAPAMGGMSGGGINGGMSAPPSMGVAPGAPGAAPGAMNMKDKKMVMPHPAPKPAGNGG